MGKPPAPQAERSHAERGFDHPIDERLDLGCGPAGELHLRDHVGAADEETRVCFGVDGLGYAALALASAYGLSLIHI